jgi:hypothetical protein
VVDYQYNFAVVSFYRTDPQALQEKIQPGDQIFIKHPQYIMTAVDFKGRKYHYQCLKVVSMADVLVNGQAVTEQAGQESLVSDTFM